MDQANEQPPAAAAEQPAAEQPASDQPAPEQPAGPAETAILKLRTQIMKNGYGMG